jgi:hypothetical protein
MRKNDPISQKKRFFRANDRFFQANGQWYFAAREGDIGPFRTRVQAHREALAYIKARGQAAAVPERATKRVSLADPTVIPGYVYRSVLSMEERVDDHRDLTLEIEEH